MKSFNDYLEAVDRPGMGEAEDDIIRLEEIRDQIAELVNEASDLIHGLSREIGSKVIFDRAESYWIRHIQGALGDEGIIGGSMFTMNSTIEELRQHTEEGPYEDAEDYEDIHDETKKKKEEED